MPKLDEYVTITQASLILGVSANTLRNWDRNGKIPVYRNPISGYRLFLMADLEDLLKEVERTGKYPSGWRKKGKPR